MKHANVVDRLIKSTYDEVHAAAGGKALTVAEAREAIVPSVAAYLETADRDFEAEARLRVDATLRTERDGRSRQLKRELEYVIDYITNPDAAAIAVEVLLARAYPLGTTTGEDKVLAHWTAEDFRNVVLTRYREAAGATEAAKDLDSVIDSLVFVIDASGASTLGAAVAANAIEVAS